MGVGVCVAVLFVLADKFSVFGAGVLGGYVFGMWLYSLVLYKLDGDGTPYWTYVIVLGLAVVGGILGLVWYNAIVILGTSIGGSYIAIRLIGAMVGNYMNETEIARTIEGGGCDSVP